MRTFALACIGAAVTISSFAHGKGSGFAYKRPARGERYETTREWDADAPITVHIMPQ